MKSHPYLRAYMAGITIPTMFLLIILTTVVSVRYIFRLPMALEHFVVFPMAVVPNAWGAWNTLRVASTTLRQIPFGWYGAMLAILLPLVGYGVAQVVNFDPQASAATLGVAWLVAVIVYYLVWKHLVSYLNELLGVSC